MDRDFYAQKIAQLNNDRLRELLELRSADNIDIIALAEDEAIRRGIDPGMIPQKSNKFITLPPKPHKDDSVNWLSDLAEFLSERD